MASSIQKKPMGLDDHAASSDETTDIPEPRRRGTYADSKYEEDYPYNQ